jgi:RsiW-degrading membrane proteinase PrsW (M82 family)
MCAILAGSAIVPALLLMWYFHARDVFPEPPRVLWGTFARGVLTIPGVLLVAVPLDFGFDQMVNPYANGFGKAFFTAAIPEELFKFVVLYGYGSRHKEFGEPMDGVVYGATASLGIATLENVLYGMNGRARGRSTPVS